MEANQEQPDWLNLPLDLLETIGNRSYDAVTGLTVFRSVCRTWRSALGHAPRLLLPTPPNSPVPRAGSEDALIFPLSRGWSIIVDARDASCRLSRPATGATVALPKINAVRDRSAASGDITHVKYVHHTDEEGACWFPGDKIKIERPAYGYWVFFGNYLDFSDYFRFAVHAPAASAADDMMIMMCHMWLLGRKTIVLCRPGDAAWTKLGDCPSFSFCFVDVAYFQGRIYGLECDGSTAVFDGATLEFLHSVDVPCATLKPCTVVEEDSPHDFDRINLVALPGKLLLVSTRVKLLEAEGFAIFELASRPDDGGLSCWRKVVRGDIGGNYDIFMDCYHTTFTFFF
uniref:KIB1-4 beta-propeller domain-containing protein n=1 Tax=Aegilops tauschii TaxID=37682 RepID=M8BSB5_AEGTA